MGRTSYAFLYLSLTIPIHLYLPYTILPFIPLELCLKKTRTSSLPYLFHSFSTSFPMSVPPQQQPVNRPTYSRTLSALRKSELVQLSVEFKLPTDGNVVTLRNRLRVYMNYHRDALMNNTRYRALFPRARDPNIPIQQSELSSQTFRTCSSSALSYEHSPSPALSYDSWHGIEDDQAPIPVIHPHQPPPQPPHPIPLYQELIVYHHPPPSPSVSESSVDSLLRLTL